MLYVLLEDAILDAIVDNIDQCTDPSDSWVEEAPLKVSFLVFARPEYAFIEFGELFCGLSIKFVENWLVKRINLQ